MARFSKLHAAAALGLIGLAGLTAVGEAQARPRNAERVIVVKPRSFLDSGVVVPVGSRNAYVQEMTYRFQQPLAKTSPGILWRPEPGYYP
jgi:hypothetical protein